MAPQLVERLEGRTLFAAGDLDPTFGLGGQVGVDVPGTIRERPTAVVVANGRIVIGGATQSGEPGDPEPQVVLAVLDASGKPVTSFSGDGIETERLSVQGGVIDLAVQSDNKIVVVAGGAGATPGPAVLARFNANGLLDTTFGGGDGEVSLPFQARAVALAPGGKIVVAGRTTGGRIGVARYTYGGATDGQVAVTFPFATSTGGGAYDVKVQADGKVLVGGSVHVNDDPDTLDGFPSDAVVVRFNASLTGVDTSFGGGDGVVRFDGGGRTEPDDATEALTLDGQGRIVTASWLANAGPVVHRLLGDGSLDPSFTITDFRASARPDDVHIAPDGKIVVSGFNFFAGDLLLRLNPSGGLDTTFGGGDGARQRDDGELVAGTFSALQPDGRIITVGQDQNAFKVFRHVADGTTPVGTATLGADRVLRVTGTEAGNDRVEFLNGGASAIQVFLNGRPLEFSLSQIDRIEVNTLGGNDYVEDRSSSGLRLRVNGGAGNDTLRGGRGSDLLYGDAGNDVIRGFDGNDRLDGGDGDDLLDGGLGADEFIGGLGIDLADYSNRIFNEHLTIGIGSFADDGVAGEGDNVRTGVENVTGGAGNDTITGDSVRNVLRGGEGSDTLRGLGGNDFFNPGSGADRVYGGDGNDEFYMRDGIKDLVLDGGSGTDKAQVDSTDPRISIEQTIP